MQQSLRLIVVRHGETAWNVDTRIQGHLDVPLNTRGLWQADRLAGALADEPIDAIYSSNLIRARQTAEAIGRVSGVPVQVEAGLRERGFGIFEGQTFEQIHSQWPEQASRWRRRDPVFAPEGGESLEAVRDRVLAATQTIVKRHVNDQQVVLVAHGGVMDVLYRAATGQALQAPRTWELGNAAINRLLSTEAGLTLVGWSDTRHLDATEPLDETTA